MKQQINLYQPIFRKQKIVFSAQTIFWLSVGLLILLLAWSQLVSQRVTSLETEHQRQIEAEQRALTQVAQLQRDLPPDQPSPQLEDRVEALEREREILNQSLIALQARMPAAEAEVGQRLDALAGHVPEGMWLTGMALGHNGSELQLRGRALAPRLVPEYLDALAAEPVLAGTGFRTVRIETAEDGRPGVRFVLSTQAEDTP